ncbi:MAG: pyrC [Oscillospiraceae bacterium]|jgi:dihydroorotase|nr:pyrC [Oscillospiraceae bacterium]
MSTLIKNAVIVNADGRQTADLLVENGIIAKIGQGLSCGDEVIDAKGAFLMPGLVDLHCHLRDPGYEYKEDVVSGSRAAAAGGFTSVLCMANTHPVNDCAAVTSYIKNKADEAGYCKVYPIGAVSKGLEGKEIAEMGDMKSAGAVAFSDDGSPVSNARLLELALLYSARFGTYVAVHPEEMSLTEGGVMNRGITATMLGLPGISRAAEEGPIARDLILAEENNARIHICHISTAGCVELIRHAKSRGVKVTCETTPHYLCLDETACEGYDVNAKVAPPLRTVADQEALIAGLLDGTVDAIATDHAPHHIDDKNMEFELAAKGISGFETAFSSCYTRLVKSEILPLEKLVEKMCLAPAQIANIPGGIIVEGQPADFFLADDKEWTVDAQKFLSRGKNTPLDGKTLSGRVLKTFQAGRLVYDRAL